MQTISMLAAAQALLSLGLSPVILDGKKPIYSSFERWQAGPGNAAELTLPEGARPLRYTAGTLAMWWADHPRGNLGILTRDRPTVDVDAEHIWPIIADLLPHTPHRKRGARGFALIYSRHPTDPIRHTRTFIDPFSKTMLLEILADGRQTVLPPSIHPDTGKPYTWEAIPAWGYLAPVPLNDIIPPPLSQATVDAIEDRLRQHGLLRARVERTAGLARKLPDSERVRYEAYLRPKVAEKLQSLQMAASGGCQGALNGMVFALAPWVREGFVDEVELEDMARAACEANGWIARDGDRAFARQFAKALDDGWDIELPDLDAGRVAALGAAPVPTVAPAGAAVVPTLAAVGGIELWDCDGAFPEPEPELIRRLLPASPGQVAFIAGKSGMGKSFCAIALAYCLATGTPFFNEPVRERVATVIVAGEGAGTLRTRLYAIAGNQALPIVIVPWSGNLADPMQRGALAEAINQKSHDIMARFGLRVGAIVIDTVSASFIIDDEGSAGEAQSIINAMRELGMHSHAVVIPIHHVGKDGTKGMRGSSAFFAAADYILMCGGEYNAETGVVSNRFLSLAKSRNGVTGPIGNVDLQIITIGTNKYLEPITTCVFCHMPGEVVTRSDSPKKHDGNRVIFDRAFDECEKRHPGLPGVLFEELRLSFSTLYPGGNGSGMRMAWGRTWKKAAIDGKYRTDGSMWYRK